MAEKYPRDRFDDIPDGIQRVGAHRAPRPKGSGWIAVGWAALAVVVLVAAGIFGLSLVSGSISFHGSPNSPRTIRRAIPSKTRRRICSRNTNPNGRIRCTALPRYWTRFSRYTAPPVPKAKVLAISVIASACRHCRPPSPSHRRASPERPLFTTSIAQYPGRQAFLVGGKAWP